MVMLTGNVHAQDAQSSDPAKKFYIYMDKESADNHYIPSGWMGDVNDLKINNQSTEAVASGTTSIAVTYTAKKSAGQGWAGAYWQSAEGNWGAQNTGYDLSDFNKLTFKAKGKKGGEVITTVKIGGITTANGQPVAYPDTASIEYGPIRLNSDWQEYTINLAGKDLSYINGGLALIFNADQAGGEQTIYLDEICFSKDETISAEKPSANFPFYVYTDNGSLDNHFIPSGWMPATAARDIKVDNNCSTTAPYSGSTCIRCEYKNTSGTRWAGIYWQQPANNWGAMPNVGFNLTGATKLTFWAKGETGNERISEFKMGGMASGEYPDSDSAGVGPIQLTKEWQKYEIDLKGRDLSYVIGGFCWSTNIDNNDPEGIVFYIDDIRYEKE